MGIAVGGFLGLQFRVGLGIVILYFVGYVGYVGYVDEFHADINRGDDSRRSVEFYGGAIIGIVGTLVGGFDTG